ncbi:SAM-dependent methyltransferase [Actinomycetes bacterium KLBMP 9759]
MNDPEEIDLMIDRAHSARMYDYYLGGKTNYAADRAVADEAMKLFPAARISTRANRAFMHRAVHHLAADHGIRQFLDIGTGIPTTPNLHEIAQSVTPDARVVYVDNDPIVLAHARALLVGDPRGTTEYIAADLRDPDSITGSSELRAVLDLSRPVALTMIAIVHFVEDDVAYAAVRQLVDLLPSGSFLALSASTADFDPEAGAGVTERYRSGGVPLHLRSHAGVATFFTGLELLEPGVTQVHKWRPEQGGFGIGFGSRSVPDRDVPTYGAVARKNQER